MNYATYSQLIENTRAKIGLLDDTARHIQVKILNIDNDVANVKIASSKFVDYAQMVKHMMMAIPLAPEKVWARITGKRL